MAGVGVFVGVGVLVGVGVGAGVGDGVGVGKAQPAFKPFLVGEHITQVWPSGNLPKDISVPGLVVYEYESMGSPFVGK